MDASPPEIQRYPKHTYDHAATVQCDLSANLTFHSLDDPQGDLCAVRSIVDLNCKLPIVLHRLD